jgi:hypothetical protein
MASSLDEHNSAFATVSAAKISLHSKNIGAYKSATPPKPESSHSELLESYYGPLKKGPGNDFISTSNHRAPVNTGQDNPSYRQKVKIRSSLSIVSNSTLCYSRVILGLGT